MKLVLCLALSTFAIHASTSYSITDLGGYGIVGSVGFGINESGQITGYTGAPDTPLAHAFYWNGTSMTDIGTLGGILSQGFAINESGQIAGTSEVFGGGPSAFFWDGTTMTDLGLFSQFGSQASGINDAGHITGKAVNSAFIWNGTSASPLGTLGGSSSFGRAINNSDNVTGYSYIAGNTAEHAFWWNGTTMIDIGAGAVGSDGLAINDSGLITGYVRSDNGTNSYRAFLWNGSTRIDLGTLAGEGTQGNGINNAGDITGQSIGATSHAFIWTNGIMSDLNDLLVNGAGWVLNAGNAINDAGQITGEGTLNGQRRAFLLTPTTSAETPEPATALLFGASLLALLAHRRKTQHTEPIA